MATRPAKVSRTSVESAVFRSFFGRIKVVFLALLVFRLGVFVPIPGLDVLKLDAFLGSFDGVVYSFMNAFSGGALERMSLLALGVMPYISASIILQLLTFAVPHFEALKKEGDFGRKQLMKYLRYFTLVLSVVQAFALSVALIGQGAASISSYMFIFSSVVSLTAGTFLLLWMGEKISEYGLGNGVSLIIFFGIVSSIPSILNGVSESLKEGTLSLLAFFVVVLLSFVMIFCVVFVEKAFRKIHVLYARARQSRVGKSDEATYLPLKVNTAGVIPPIFATSVLMLPTALSGWLLNNVDSPFILKLAQTLEPGQPLYFLLFSAMVSFFCFFYSAIVVNPDELSDNLKRAGAVIPGVRPGSSTSAFIDSVQSRLAMIGSIYMIFVCLFPQLAQVFFSFPFYLGGTSLLIVVSVVMDFISQSQSFIMSGRYSGLVKKAGISGV